MKRLIENKEIFITILIFIVIFSIRLICISNSPAEAGDVWRQPDTESIARNFIEHRFNIFYPQFNYDGPLPNYVQLELQLTTFIIAILYKVFGYHYAIARLVPIGFFMISVFYLYLLAKKYFSQQAAWLTIFVYSSLPITLFYSRAIMPESAALCFFIGAFYYFTEWIDHEENYLIIIAGIFTALAISQKVPAVFIGLAMLALALFKYKSRIFLQWQLWLFAIISLIPPIVYYKWMEKVAEFKFVTGIAQKHIVPKFLHSFLTPEAWAFFHINMVESFTKYLLITSVIGFFILIKRKEKPILFWAIAMVLEVVLIVSVIKFNYYLIFLSPIIALLTGAVFDSLLRNIVPGIIISLIFVVFVFNLSFNQTRPLFKEDTNSIEFARFIDQNTKKEDLLILGDISPTVLSLSDRQGWRTYEFTPENMESKMYSFINHGAKYFVVNKNYIYNDDGRYLRYLENNFEKIDFGNGYKFYVLK